VLGLHQDAAGITLVKHTLDNVIPRWHHAKAYRDPDRGFDAGLVDTYLHARERAYTVPEVLLLISESNLKFQSWLDNLDYSVSLHIPDSQDPLRTLIETLPRADQWRLAELIGQAMGRHFVLACHVDRPEAHYALDFTGQEWLDYVPSLRPGIVMPGGRRSDTILGLPPTAMSIRRYGHQVELSMLEAGLFVQVDGKKSIIEILEDDTLNESNALQRIQLAREFFGRMAEWDHLLYEIP
jgi:hypothetical protein